MSKEWDPENVFDVLGSEVARKILALASLRPLSADELADHCNVSKPTVYRRIQALQEYDMLAEEMELDDDGHHYKVFRTSLREARFHVDDGVFDIDIQLERDYTDKFMDFWQDMEEGAEGLSEGSDPASPGSDHRGSDVSGG